MAMEIGIFLPIAKNGFIMSRNVPQTWPTWELNRDVTLKCEAAGFDFALSMVKFRGFGGEIEYWDHALDSFTLTAALAPGNQHHKVDPLCHQPVAASGGNCAHGRDDRGCRTRTVWAQYRVRLV